MSDEELVLRVAKVLARQYAVRARWDAWSEDSKGFFLESARAVLKELGL
jgi:hypothetical protein